MVPPPVNSEKFIFSYKSFKSFAAQNEIFSTKDQINVKLILESKSR